MAPDRPFDVGLQTERTALAWQRTVLASTVATLMATRLLANVIGALSFLVAAIGLVIAVALFTLGHRRYRTAHEALIGSAGHHVPLTTAAPLFAWAVVVFALAILGLIFVIVVALGR